MSKKTLVINLFGGPGVGKSTKAAKIYSTLKEKGYNCELAAEYAKDLVWQESMHVLKNQIYLLGKQHHRVWRLLGKVDVVITDSPIMLCMVYGHDSEHFRNLIKEEHDKMDTLNIVLTRKYQYVQEGRNQNEEESIEIDNNIIKMLKDYDVKYETFNDSGQLLMFIEQVLKMRTFKEADKAYVDYCRDHPTEKVIYEEFIANYKN